MNFPRLTFPLTVDFGDDGYWVGEQGPFKYGAAVTAFFIGEDIGEVSDDGIPLMQELEHQLQTFGSHLQPYAKDDPIDGDLFFEPEAQSVNSAVCFTFHVTGKGRGVMTERYIFSSLRDFLFVELGKSILRGNAPRQCRLCGCWFLHEQGDRAMYCERIAPGEESKTCMSILGAVIVSHPPLIIPTVGRGREQEVQATIDAYRTAAKQVAAWEPEVLIITAPRQVMYADYLHISPGRGAAGDMSAFGASKTKEKPPGSGLERQDSGSRITFPLLRGQSRGRSSDSQIEVVRNRTAPPAFWPNSTEPSAPGRRRC